MQQHRFTEPLTNLFKNKFGRIYQSVYFYILITNHVSKADQTKAFIIEKTAPLFNTKGYEGTSMSDIEAATGLTKGSIYGNFTNKDEVALAVFDFNLQKIDNIIRS